MDFLSLAGSLSLKPIHSFYCCIKITALISLWTIDMYFDCHSFQHFQNIYEYLTCNIFFFDVHNMFGDYSYISDHIYLRQLYCTKSITQP